jgi:hypothetical protein
MLMYRCPGDSAIIDVSTAAIRPDAYTRKPASSARAQGVHNLESHHCDAGRVGACEQARRRDEQQQQRGPQLIELG